jgi:hypothetical protein
MSYIDEILNENVHPEAREHVRQNLDVVLEKAAAEESKRFIQEKRAKAAAKLQNEWQAQRDDLKNVKGGNYALLKSQLREKWKNDHGVDPVAEGWD